MRKSTVVGTVYVVALILLWVFIGRQGMENRTFIVTGYGLTWGVLLWYAFRLEGRTGATARAVQSYETTGGGD
jgi:hypothetical protein